MKVAVVGATGMVGQVMLKLIEERNFPVSELILVASERSVGKEVKHKNTTIKVVSMSDAVSMVPDIALFSAGADTSLKWAPNFAEGGTTVIDNSSAWRMHPAYKLIVPEINASELSESDKIIANPNCSTIQLVMALNPLHKKYGVKRAVVSTYQSISGTGVKAVRQFENERKGTSGEMAYPYTIDKNCLPHCDAFMENDYTKEEMKLHNETKKILSDDSVQVVATAVRVPVQGGHSESVNVQLEKPCSVGEIKKMMHETEGVTLKDNPTVNSYPMPAYSEGLDDVFVGRIRKDFTQANTFNLWIVADNLRKGAATNAIQIAEYLVKNKLVGLETV